MAQLRKAIKTFVPGWLLDLRARHLTRMRDREFRGKSPQEIFSRIYREGLWSDPAAQGDFVSGSGSHDSRVVAPYIAAVRDFVAQLPQAPDVVDLGCGDFKVGGQLRPLCERYIACDVVPDLIARNTGAFADLNVDFRHLDIVGAPLPGGDVAFLRQVLQHLGNEQVAAVSAKLHTYRHVILTEHLPVSRRFVPNAEKPAGPGTRLARLSGLVLTEPPFNLNPIETRIICSVEHGGGRIQTLAYRFA